MFLQTQKSRRVVRAALCFGWLWMAVCSSSCVPPNGPNWEGHPDRLGTLEASGLEVYLDGRPGRSGDVIRDGSHVSTGAGSMARVRFSDGSFVQLDENTDPWFRIARDSVTGQRCVFIEIGFGQVYVYKHNVCIKTPDVEGILNSKANVKVMKDEATEIALFEGRAQIHRPSGILLRSGELAVFSRGKVIKDPRRMSDREIQEIPSWVHPIEPPPGRGWCCANGRVFQTSPQDCERSRGFFSFDRNEVLQKCQRLGWCCKDGKLFESTPEQCARTQGFFSFDRNEVLQKCQRLGWCCKDGKVFQTNREKCAQIKGFFSFNRREAQRKCSPPLE